jgi:uncharacterized protein YjiS (DUF1127 family)
MIIALKYFVNSLISNVKINRATPRLNLSRFSDHDLEDLNLPPSHRHRIRQSHELGDWRARLVR